MPVDVAQQSQDGAGRLRVERAGRLVGEQHLRVAGQGACDADALFLAAGELCGVDPGLVGEADEVEQFQGPAGAFLPGVAEDLQRQFDVVLDGARGQQVEVLEDHADGAARAAQFLAGPSAAPGERGQIGPVDAHGARRGAFEEVDAADEGGLPGAAAADDSEDLALAYVQVDAVQSGDRMAARPACPAGPVDLRQARSGDHRGFRHCRVRGAMAAGARGVAGGAGGGPTGRGAARHGPSAHGGPRPVTCAVVGDRAALCAGGRGPGA